MVVNSATKKEPKLAKGQLIQLEAEYLTSTYQTAMQSIEQTILEKLLEVEEKMRLCVSRRTVEKGSGRQSG